MAVGTCLGPYRVEGKLGEGGMGEVFRAVDTRLGRAVAIKTTHAQFSSRFERETRAISALNHPNVCTLYDVGPNYLVMELVEGETLAALLKNGPLHRIAARLLQDLLYGVPPLNPLMVSTAAVAFAGVWLGGIYLPARRATAVDPSRALRWE